MFAAPDRQGRVPEAQEPAESVNAIIIVIHLLASLVLILFVLLHAGRGGGLSDMFGGNVGGSMAGSTVVEKNLDRLTVIAALVFTFTTILLAIRLQ
jgi:preprotein translocase subunit SecG